MGDFVIFGLCFGSVTLGIVASYPPLAKRIIDYIRERSSEATTALEDMFMNLSHHRVWVLHAASPVVVGAVAWLLSEQWIFGVLGVAVGMIIPKLIIANIDRMRRRKFHGQLVDGLLLLSSSLKAGLSMLQSFTVLAEEMPTPISQEFGLVLKETKMGLDVSQAMGHLKKRMPSDDTTLFVTAVLVGRETGGDITHIFGRLVETLRERKKIKERVKSLTFMTRMQAVIMSALPFAFGYMVYQMDHNYFQFFVTDETGRLLLVVIVIMQVIGAVLFFRFSRSPI